MKRISGLYLHIPFCLDKCFYCAFTSFKNKNALIEPYIQALLDEMDAGLKNDSELNSIYIGGGTPSILKIEQFQKIFEKIYSLSKVSKTAEITVEINPATVDKAYLQELLKLGVNRLSIGVQSFDDGILKLINRKHNKDEALETINLAKEVGFKNISIDLMYGLPSQNLDGWLSDIKTATELNIQHISTYGLKIEPDTIFYKIKPKNLPDDDTQVDMYMKTIEILQENGFKHYEISNFAKDGFESKHNLCYWQNQEYFGFGLSAHGYVDGKRYANVYDLEKYIQNPWKKDFSHIVSGQEKMEEEIFLGLRLRKGLNIKEFNRKYETDFCEKYQKIIDKFTNMKLLSLSRGYIQLTVDGILLSNSVLAEFLF